MRVNRGFMIFENRGSTGWVTPHSGPALETPTSRDDNSDTVASLCWMKVGGTLVMSTMPRKRSCGIDFNRDAPPLDESLKYHPWFACNINPEELHAYREKYAWSAANKRDHDRRQRIYDGFWEAARKSGRTVTFVHRKFTRLKNFPSIMDIVTYEGHGFSRGMLAPVVGRVNSRYAQFFRSISRHYKDAIILEERRVLDRIMQIFPRFDLSAIDVEYRTNLIEDLKVIKRFASASVVKRLDRHFTPRNFMTGVKSALNSAGDPRITVESIFKGKYARSQAARLYRTKNVIEVESNAFLNYWYPNEAADIILEVVNRVVPMRKITNYLQER